MKKVQIKLLFIALLFSASAFSQPDTTVIKKVDSLQSVNLTYKKQIRKQKTTGLIAYFVAVIAGFIAIIK